MDQFGIKDQVQDMEMACGRGPDKWANIDPTQIENLHPDRKLDALKARNKIFDQQKGKTFVRHGIDLDSDALNECWFDTKESLEKFTTSLLEP